ncbi:MAG TPA: carboxypeptidase M32 [Chthonomonadales bacterium]|nr:carboxypeptidase M32 [Chthonomonadales bacterium]
MAESLLKLKERVKDLFHLRGISALLDWDQQTYMPPGGAAERAEASALVSKISHELFTSDETGELLAQAEVDLQGVSEESDEARELKVLRRDYDLATRLPVDLVAELARHSALAQEIWTRARAQSDFAAFAPALEKMVELVRRQASCLGYKDHIYDPLIDLYEPGCRQATVAAMFAELRPQLVRLTKAIAASDSGAGDRVLRGDFPPEAQRAFTLKAAADLGYDLTRGRQDEAAHPFATNFSRDDVRITTRFDPLFLAQGLYGSLHEAGHAMYEQGSPAEYEGTALAGAVSLGIHESQSRFWENLIGRSRAYMEYLLPQLRASFPGRFDSVGVETLYHAVNVVEPSFIRVEADEVTYNLHVLLRFDLECDLLTGKLKVADLPEAWNAGMMEYLGIRPPDDAHGVLQDIHWSGGMIGYFPTYSIGNLVSAQLLHSAEAALPDLQGMICKGEFEPLLEWLRHNVHRYGRKYMPDELIRKATGEPLSSSCYVSYLNRKYGELYGV